MRVVLPWRLSDEPLSGDEKHSAAEVREIANCVFQTVAILIFLPALGFSGLAYGLGCPDDAGGTGGGRCDVAGRRFHPALWAIGGPLAVGGAVGAVVLFVYFLWFMAYLLSWLMGIEVPMLSRSTMRKVYVAWIAVMLLLAFCMAVGSWQLSGIAYSVGAAALLLLAVAYKRRWVPADADVMMKYVWRAFGAMLLGLLLALTGVGMVLALPLFFGAFVVLFASSVTFYILDCRDSQRQCCEEGAMNVAVDVFRIVQWVFEGLGGDGDGEGGASGVFAGLFEGIGAVVGGIFEAL